MIAEEPTTPSTRAASFVQKLRAVRASVWWRPVVRVSMIFAGLLVLARIGQAAQETMTVPAVTPFLVATAASVVDGGELDAVDAGAPAPAIAVNALPVAPHDSALVALNEATNADLERLPGIGPKKAEAIVALRSKMGRFRAIEDLLRVKGIGRKRLAKIRPLVTLERS